MLKKPLSVVLRTVAEVETRRESKRTKVQTAVSWVVCVVRTSLVSSQLIVMRERETTRTARHYLLGWEYDGLQTVRFTGQSSEIGLRNLR